jgi:hypothetical protein
MAFLLPVLAEAPMTIPGWAWVAFLGFVASMLALDLGVFNKTDHKPSFKEAVAWCVVWISLAVGFGFLLSAWKGPEDAQLFAAGYVLELALSVDNLFIFILVFAHFKIPDHLQHRVLFWGIIGAVAMRAAFIIAGVAAVEKFTWLLPIFGLFLLFTRIKLALSLNAATLTREQSGYGLGSYVYTDGAVHFSGFVPNALYKPGLLRNLFASCAARAQRMAAFFVDGRWDPETYSLDAEVLARRRARKQATMPVVERPIQGCPMMRARAGGS